ncbi:acetylglutamate kinase [Enterococcus asini]|uniref:acetylglutamate kinase n=1 Tax=Enterococcus asini TaxID=57732 RepID=UPI00288E8781|nr:acetylglutamate kinase [Enterococcus asini]MDT2757591.1 acetylglutamate kinase [Enterococcus asini]
MGVIVVKMGGIASDNLDQSFFNQIKKWRANGKQVVIVHGGGYYISEMMTRLGQKVQIKNGLRVTDSSALDVTRMVLLGQVQPLITTKFLSEGFHALGLSAGSDQLIQGVFLNEAELGFVGKVTNVNHPLLKLLLEKNHIPIIAPLGITESGQWLNINADEVACKVAAALHAEALYLLTDVPGICRKGEWLTEVAAPEVTELIRQKVITGGMLPKVHGAQKALLAGVKSVCINNSIVTKGTQLLTKECAQVKA